MLTLLLAPSFGALAAVCHCDHDSVDAVEVAPIPCCGETQQCCYRHDEFHGATLLVAELNPQSRADFKAALRQVVELLPGPAAAVAPEHNLIRCADPPDRAVRELSLRQSWLI